MENQLASAFEFEVTGKSDGIYSVIRETKKISTDPSDKKGLKLIVLDECPDNPREVLFFQAHGRVEGLKCHMKSLTDDLIWSQWFKVKDHKKKQKKEVS